MILRSTTRKLMSASGHTHFGWWLLASAASSFSVILIGWAAGCGDWVFWVWLGVLVVTITGGLPSTVMLAYRAERRERAETARSERAERSAEIDRKSVPPHFGS